MRERRTQRLSWLLLAAFALLAANLARMQLIQGGYYRERSEKNRIRVVYLEAGRGKILDRRGVPLAENRLSFNCSAFYREAQYQIGESCRILSPLVGEDAATLERRFNKQSAGAYRTVLIAEDISAQQAIAIEERLDALPGIVIETRPQRRYPFGEAASHLTGYIGPMTDEEQETIEFFGYSRADWLGQDGAEKSYESYLRGFSGGLQIEVDSRGRTIRALGVREPREGKDLQLTVDARLQQAVQELLKAHKGAVLVMDLKDGGLLAVNSSPAYDPNLFSSKRGRREVGKYLFDGAAPMVNRGIRGSYPPGSIFKIVTALAGLESKKINAQKTIQCGGFLRIGGRDFPCWKEEGHGPQDMADAFAHSCNVYFFTAGLSAGLDAIVQKGTEIGFARLSGVDLPGEKEGLLPTRAWKKKRFHEPWYDGETANLAIGQGYLQVTPVQALVMIAAVATNGQLLRPHVADRIGGIKIDEPHSRNLIASPARWAALKKGLDKVINDDTGTGRLARVPGLRIAGKTGTAQSGQNKDHAWFVGFAPLEKPKVAVAVFMEHGGKGGVLAASTANAVFKWLKEASYLDG